MDNQYDSQIMSEDEISYAIKDYIENAPYSYAVMIDGEWGCGKTYYVNNRLIKEIEALEYNEAEELKGKSNYKVIKISLYGINDVSDISKQMFTSIYTYSIPKAMKKITKPLIGAGLKIASDYFDKPYLSGAVEESGLLLEAFADLNKYVFIFDDLERCSIPVHEVLGFINNMVETNGVKVILIAYQKEIHSIPNQKNKELKYLLSCIDSIAYPEKPKPKGRSKAEYENNVFENALMEKNDNKEDSSENKVDINEVKYRSQLLFSENEYYLAIKEKLIGKTFYFRPSLSDAIPSIVKNCTNNIDIGLDISDITEKLLNVENYYNLRTVQGALILFDKVFNVFKQVDFDNIKIDNVELFTKEMKLDIVSTILKSILFQAILVASGYPHLQWESNEEYKEYIWDNKYNNCQYIVFRFVELYFINGYWNTELVHSVILTYIKNRIQQQFIAKDPLHTLSYYYTLSNEEIICLLNDFDERFFNSTYKSSLFPQILKFLLDLEHIGINTIINFDFSKYFNFMCAYVSNNGMAHENFYSQTISEFKEVQEKQKECIAKLSDIAKERESRSISIFQNALSTEPGWGNDFSAAYADLKENDITKAISIISLIDIHHCLECFKHSTAKDMQSFRSALIENYRTNFNKEIFKKDIKKFEQLSKDTQAIIDSGVQEITKKLQLEFLVLNIQDIIDNKL